MSIGTSMAVPVAVYRKTVGKRAGYLKAIGLTTYLKFVNHQCCQLLTAFEDFLIKLRAAREKVFQLSPFVVYDITTSECASSPCWEEEAREDASLIWVLATVALS
jgi:hypothetical protein